MTPLRPFLFAALGSFLLATPARAQRPGQCTIEVQVDQPGAAIAPTLYGAFFEDINFGADGGLSAELVKNGSFEFFDPISGWSKVEPAGAVGGIGVSTEQPRYANNPNFGRLIVQAAGPGCGLRNAGYRGMGVRQGERYFFSAAARLVAGAPQPLRVELLDPQGKVIGETRVALDRPHWVTVEGCLTASATEPKATLRLLLDQPATLDLDAVSLMPEHTWKNRRNGLRPDLVQLLADLKPGFLRFPGGCIVEGRTLPGRYQWKNTIGPVEERRLLINRWNVEFADRGRGAHDYFQSFRVGFLEYFQLCEDLGAAPLPILNCGMACQYNSGECAPLGELEPFIQDALDLIEFANGPATSDWGRRRCELGHPAPFGLTMLGVGNEQWGPQYFERYQRFAQAIRARYPQVKLVVSAGPSPDGAQFAHAWEQIRRGRADIVDEHCYALPEWFLDNTHRFDAYDRQGPKIFMGEYAAHPKGVGNAASHNTWGAALAEAAYLTGLERNADVVTMSSYAPLFAHAEAWQWRPDLIWFDNLHSYGTPSYHVQRLFSLNRGDTVLPVTTAGVPVAANGQPRFYVTASRDTASGGIILKVVNATTGDVTTTVALRGIGRLTGPAQVIQLGAADPAAENSFDQPAVVAPQTTELAVSGPAFSATFPALSLTILRLQGKR